MMNILLLLGLGFAVPQVSSDDWPQFQGPERTGRAPALASTFDWKGGSPAIAWSVEVGRGYGGAAVRDSVVYFLDRMSGEGDFLRAFALETGEQQWDSFYEAPGSVNFPGTRSVPAVTEKFVLTQGVFGHVTCFNRESGSIVWQTDLSEVYGGRLPLYGWSNSPLVFGDTIVVSALGADVGLVGLDIATGDERWVTESVGYSHSTPVLLELLGKAFVVFLSHENPASGQDAPAPSTIFGFDPADGGTRWKVATMLSRLPIPAPVRIDNERIFVTGGYRAGSTMLKIAKKDGEYTFEELFHIDRGAQVHIPLLHDDHLYLIVNENWNDARPRRTEGGLLCLSLDGEQMWRTADDPHFGRGNLLLAGDHLLVQDGQSGMLRVIPATPAGYAPLAEANVFEVTDRRDHQMWAPMALAGRRLLMRSQDKLVCLEI